MRPVPVTGNAGNRGASHSRADDLSPNVAIQTMTYFMATEDTLDRVDDRNFQPPHSHRYSHNKHGVDSGSRAVKGHHQQQSSMSASTSISWPSPSLASQQGIDTPQDLSRPMTPVFVEHSGAESAISCLSSPRSSLAASPVSPSRNSSVVSLVHTPQSGTGQYQLADAFQGATIPQFIMPSVPVPRRRPFSDAGKSLGKLKVLVTGQPGLGTSSLISSIAQSCEHIVHMDSTTPSQQRGGAMEIYASTRPCPWWQTELEPSTLLMRRPSTTDEILDRNVCFVDCSAIQKSDGKHPAVGYVESQMLSLLTRPISDGDLWKLLSNGAEPIVDAVLYLLPHTGPKPVDIAIIRDLQSKTNVIPLLARADELVDEEISSSQQRLKRQLESQDADYFSFAVPGSQQVVSDIYAVSNIPEPDHDVMDASILMNSEYERPLVSTDLKRLVENMLSPDGCARLRHSASLKCVNWRRSQNHSLSSALTRRGPTGANIQPPVITGNLFMQQQYWRRIEVGSWAESLRQSLAAERRGETPLQLGYGSMAYDMSLAKIEQHKHGRRHGRSRRQNEIPKHQDPLGLLGLAGQLKCNGKQTIELLSSVGVLGYLTAQLGGDLGILPKW